jgi:threonine synthase
MLFYSTKNKTQKVSFEEAVVKGMPSDGGLYMPEDIPFVSDDFMKRLPDMTYKDTAFYLSSLLLDDFPKKDLKRIIDDAYTFEPPVIYLNNKIGILELFHGPTMAFKDYGARFMSRIMSYYVKRSNKKLNILIATSGDTGSAVGNGFQDVENIHVTILYPSGKISEIQEKQISTLTGNISSLEVDGTFDDCQKLVKTAFLDDELSTKLNLSSANSINISRLIPQIFYYFYAYAQAKLKSDKIVFSVPSGNFGNLTAGLIALKMGLPVHTFIAATNINHVVPDYLLSGNYLPKPSIQTISNAMDVGDPGNFIRMQDMFGYIEMQKVVKGYWFDDDETRRAIVKIYKELKYVIDPHGAIAYLALKKYLTEIDNDIFGVVLETAHYSKFLDVISPLIKTKLSIPDRLKSYLNLENKSIRISKNYEDLKKYLLET